MLRDNVMKKWHDYNVLTSDVEDQVIVILSNAERSI